jgi:hypothetical protein
MAYFKCEAGKYREFKDPRPTHRAGVVPALLELEPHVREGILALARRDQNAAYGVLAVHRAAEKIRSPAA